MGVATSPAITHTEVKTERETERQRERKIQLGRSCVLIYVTDEQQSALREKEIEFENYRNQLF